MLSCLLPLQWAITWMRYSPLALPQSMRCACRGPMGWGVPNYMRSARSTTLESMLYVSPAWWGFTSVRNKGRLKKLIGRLRMGGFLPEDIVSFSDLVAEADRSLDHVFRSLVSNPTHVLSRHFSALKTTNYNLRPRANGVTLPEKDNCNFIPRMLFERIYYQAYWFSVLLAVRFSNIFKVRSYFS